MAERRFKKDSPEWVMMNDFLVLLQRFYDPEDSSEYWESVVYSQNEFYEKHKSMLGRKLANLFINYLEDKWKENRKNG